MGKAEVEEERAKQTAGGNKPPAETPPRRDAESTDRVKELERRNRDLEIATRAKDFYLERLEKERGQYVEQLVSMSRYVGKLETPKPIDHHECESRTYDARRNPSRRLHETNGAVAKRTRPRPWGAAPPGERNYPRQTGDHARHFAAARPVFRAVAALLAERPNRV